MQEKTQASKFQLVILPFIVCIAASLFYAYQYLVRVMPSAMTHELMSSYSIKAAGLGILSSLFFYGYAIVQIPSGVVFDRYSPRLLLSLAMLICAASTLVFGLFQFYEVALLMRFIAGGMAASAFIGAIVVASRWFPPKYLGTASGIIQFFGCLGAIMGQGPVAVIVSHFGWQKTAYIVAGIGVALSIITYLVVRDNPPNHHEKHVATDDKAQRLPFHKVFSRRQNWWIALYGFCVWTPLVVFAVLWAIPFLGVLFNISHAKAASYVSIIWLGTGVGGPILGWWSARIGLRRIPMITAPVIGLISIMMLVYWLKEPGPLYMIFLFLLGTCGSAQSLAFAVTSDGNHKSILGTAIAFINLSVIFGGVVFQPLVGYILDWVWGGETRHGVPVFSTMEYHIALAIIPICLFIAVLVSLFAIKETHCISQHDSRPDSGNAHT